MIHPQDGFEWGADSHRAQGLPVQKHGSNKQLCRPVLASHNCGVDTVKYPAFWDFSWRRSLGM